MKILHVITSLRTGGAEKLMVDLLPRLQANGLDIDLLLFDGTSTPFKQQAERAGIKIYDLGTGGSVYSPRRLFKLLPFLRRYDIIHTHNTAPQLFAAAGSYFSSATLITTEHNTSNRRRKWRWYRLIDKWMYRRYKKVICISEKAESNLRDHIGASRAEIVTINNGVDIAKYAKADSSKDLETIAPGSKKIIMVAGFRWEKDQDTLIKSLQYLPDDFHLFLVGDGERREELEKHTQKLQLNTRVHFLGQRTDVSNLLHEADYIVMSSHFEGLSLSSIEGMSVGKPFIASDVDGLREVVKDAGILFKHQDEKELAQIILRLSANSKEYEDTGMKCYARANEYDIKIMEQHYNNLYKSL